METIQSAITESSCQENNNLRWTKLPEDSFSQQAGVNPVKDVFSLLNVWSIVGIFNGTLFHFTYIIKFYVLYTSYNFKIQ